MVENLEKDFGDKHVLSGADFVFEQGKIYGLLGRNGAGKTTLFNCLGGEMQADRGSMKLVQGHSSRDLQPEDVGYVYALPILPEFLTGYEFIRFYIDVNQAAIADRETI